MLVHPLALTGRWRQRFGTGRSGSIVETTRFQLHQFTVSIKELAEWFELEVARIVVDECLTPRWN
jgi:hypothetical protein